MSKNFPKLKTLLRPLARTFESLRMNRAERRALRVRQKFLSSFATHLLVRPDWSVQVPHRLNQAAFVALSSGKVRVTTRSLHRRNQKFCFSLKADSAADELGQVLACLDPAEDKVYLLFVESGPDRSAYLTFTLDEARQQALEVLSLRS